MKLKKRIKIEIKESLLIEIRLNLVFLRLNLANSANSINLLNIIIRHDLKFSAKYLQGYYVLQMH